LRRGRSKKKSANADFYALDGFWGVVYIVNETHPGSLGLPTNGVSKTPEEGGSTMRRLFAAIGSAIALFIAIALVAPPPSPAAALNGLYLMNASSIDGSTTTTQDGSAVIANSVKGETPAAFDDICAIGASTGGGSRGIDTYGPAAVTLTDWKLPAYGYGATSTLNFSRDADGHALASTGGIISPTTPAHLRC